MIGGLSFMVSGKLCCGVNRMGILVRIAPEVRKQVLGQPHVHPMKLAGRTISSFVRVDPEAYRTDTALAKWVRMGVSFALAALRREIARPLASFMLKCRFLLGKLQTFQNDRFTHPNGGCNRQLHRKPDNVLSLFLRLSVGDAGHLFASHEVRFPRPPTGRD
jgi:TfoX N-terminal domain